jgi:hypothetical protein
LAGSRPGGRGTVLLLRQKKVPKEKASRMRCPSASLRAHCVARSGRGCAQTRFAQTCAPLFPARPCATRQRMTAESGNGDIFPRQVGWRGLSPQPSPQRGEGVKARLARRGVPSRLCRVAGLSSTAAWGSEIRMSEGRAADKFANFPHDASSARKPAGPRPGQAKPPERKANARAGIRISAITPPLIPL